MAILIIALISGCSKDDFLEKTGVCPIVLSTIPVDKATGVNVNQVISATFNEEINSSTITNSSFIVLAGTTQISGVISYSGTIASFTPTSPLAENTTYLARITTAVKDLDGNALQVDYVWTFTTGLILRPAIISTDPANNATGVDLNKTVTATFNMPMDPATLVNPATTFTVKQGLVSIAGVVTYSGSTASFNPTVAFLSNKVYTATISTVAKNVAGLAMAANYVWSFTTVIPISGGPVPPAASGLTLGVFGGNAGVTNQGLLTKINNGSIATTAASTLVTGLKDGTTGDVYTVTPLNNGLVSGRIYAAAPAPGNAVSAAIATQGLIDATAAYLSISPASKPGGIDPGAGELGGLTLAPGLYKASSGTFKITKGDLTLDAQGDANAVWIFQTAAALTVGDSAPSSVKLTGGAQAKNVYWYVGSTAVINYAGGGVMSGTIIANSGVTLSSPANNTAPAGSETVLNGKAISLVSSVTMVNTIINVQ